MYSTIIPIQHSGKDKTVETKNISGCQGLEEKTSKCAEHKGFRDSENALYDIFMMNRCHYTVVQIHRMYNTKGEL